MSLPSIRECEQRLQALGAAEPDHPAIAIARALLHYVRNAGTPPAAPPTPKQRAMSLAPVSKPDVTPMHLVRPPERPKPAPKPPVAQAQIEPRPKRLPFVVPPGRVTKAQLIERGGFGKSYIDLLLATHAIEQPIEPGNNNRPALWSEEQAARIVRFLSNPDARRSAAKKKATADPPRPTPEGWVSAQEFARRLGFSSVDRIHVLVHNGRIEPAPHRQDRRVFWDEAYVAQVVSTLVVQRRKPR